MEKGNETEENLRTKDGSGTIIKIDAINNVVEIIEKSKILGFIPTIGYVEYSYDNQNGVIHGGEYVYGSEGYSNLNRLIWRRA